MVDGEDDNIGPLGKPLVDYPTDYVFKVIGVHEDHFLEYVRLTFGRILGSEISPLAITTQASSKGKYLSVSISVYLVSESQRRSIYEHLHKDRRVIYYL